MAATYFDPAPLYNHRLGERYPVGPGTLQAKSEISLPPIEKRYPGVSAVTVGELSLNRGYPGLSVTPDQRDPAQPVVVIVPGAHQTPATYLSFALPLAALGIRSVICGVPHHRRDPLVRPVSEGELKNILADHVAFARTDGSEVHLVTHSLGDALARAYLIDLAKEQSPAEIRKMIRGFTSIAPDPLCGLSLPSWEALQRDPKAFIRANLAQDFDVVYESDKILELFGNLGSLKPNRDTYQGFGGGCYSFYLRRHLPLGILEALKLRGLKVPRMVIALGNDQIFLKWHTTAYAHAHGVESKWRVTIPNADHLVQLQMDSPCSEIAQWVRALGASCVRREKVRYGIAVRA